jgi:hypothetical protein
MLTLPWVLEIKAKKISDQLPKIYAHLQPGKVTDYEKKVKNLTVGTATWILDLSHLWIGANARHLFYSSLVARGQASRIYPQESSSISA